MAHIDSIRDQLAFEGEFGNRASGTHVDTRIAMIPYEVATHQSTDELMAGKPFRPYALKPEGEKLAKESPLYWCFRWLRENGFTYVAPRAGSHTQKGNFIKYDSCEVDEAGRPVTTAFISSWSRVYVNRRVPGKVGATCEFDGREPAKLQRKATREMAGVRPAGER